MLAVSVSMNLCEQVALSLLGRILLSHVSLCILSRFCRNLSNLKKISLKSLCKFCTQFIWCVCVCFVKLTQFEWLLSVRMLIIFSSNQEKCCPEILRVPLCCLTTKPSDFIHTKMSIHWAAEGAETLEFLISVYAKVSQTHFHPSLRMKVTEINERILIKTGSDLRFWMQN